MAKWRRWKRQCWDQGDESTKLLTQSRKLPHIQSLSVTSCVCYCCNYPVLCPGLALVIRTRSKGRAVRMPAHEVFRRSTVYIEFSLYITLFNEWNVKGIEHIHTEICSEKPVYAANDESNMMVKTRDVQHLKKIQKVKSDLMDFLWIEWIWFHMNRLIDLFIKLRQCKICVQLLW